MAEEMGIKYLWDENNPSGYCNRMGAYKTNQESDFIARYIKGKEILDIGGGSGRIAFPLIKEGYDVTIVDKNEEAIRICKQRGINKAFCSDIKDFYNDKYDTVLAIEFINYIPFQSFLSTAGNLLKSGGILIFTGNNKRSWRYFLHNFKKNKTPDLGALTLYEFKRFIAVNGFRILEIKGFNWMPLKVNSNSFLVPAFARVESFFKLGRWLSQSPYFLFACIKSDDNHQS
jgi:SAM-dependent methyltransferase